MAVLVGVRVRYGAFAVLVGAARFGIEADLTEREWRNAGNGVGVAAGMLPFLAYLFGGFVSGRMARRAGLANGLFVFIGALAVAAATVGIVRHRNTRSCDGATAVVECAPPRCPG